jgi:hypothetical protein
MASKPLKVTRNEICFQNYINLTTDSKQIKILILNNFALRQNHYFKKKVTRNEICFQNYIKFTKDPKQTKILIKI